MTHKPKGLDKTDSQFGRICVAALTWGMPSQSSASCMASVAFSTGFTGSHVSQSGHSPTKDTQINSGRHCWAGLNGQKTTQVPGAQLSTSAPSALPLLQSRLKLVIGRSGTLCWIQPRRRCFGVFDSA